MFSRKSDTSIVTKSSWKKKQQPLIRSNIKSNQPACGVRLSPKWKKSQPNYRTNEICEKYKRRGCAEMPSARFGVQCQLRFSAIGQWNHSASWKCASNICLTSTCPGCTDSSKLSSHKEHQFYSEK